MKKNAVAIDLFPETIEPKPPRAKPRFLMHVSDSGQGFYQFTCKKCLTESDWLIVDTVGEAKRGLPCPNCNEQE
jgi:hypothetical protein